MLNICKHIGRSFHDEGILYINWKKKDGLTQKNEKTKKQTPDINKIWIEQNCPLGCEHAWWESENYISNEGSLKQVWSC